MWYRVLAVWFTIDSKKSLNGAAAQSPRQSRRAQPSRILRGTSEGGLKDCQCNTETGDQGRGAERQHDQCLFLMFVQMLHAEIGRQAKIRSAPVEVQGDFLRFNFRTRRQRLCVASLFGAVVP